MDERREKFIVDDADIYADPDGIMLPLGVDEALTDAKGQGLSDSNAQRVRGAVGMALEAMGDINADLHFGESRRRKKLGSLMDPQVAVLAGTMPERIFRPQGENAQLQALMEIVSNVGVPKDLSLYEKAGLVMGPSLAQLNPRAMKLVMGMARGHVLSEVGGFVNIYENCSPQNVIPELEMDEAFSGISYEANLVTESARTEAEARKNIDWYKGAIKAGAKRISIKPTSLVPFSDSALAKPVVKAKMADALKEIFAVAGYSVIISVDSERSDIVDVVRDAFIDASREFPRVKVQIAMQAYLSDTESMLLDPVMEASKKRVSDQRGVPMGARLVNGANKEGEETLASSMGWMRGTPLTGSRAESHANFMRLRKRMIDPLKDGNFTLTVATMNMITLMDSLQELARAGVLASKNGGFVQFAMLKGMTGQEVFRYLQTKYGITAHEYVPVISQADIVELFKYYLRRIEELASKLKSFEGEEAIANYLGVMSKFGIYSPEFLNTQVANGVVKAMLHHQKNDICLDPKIQGYRGDNEPLVVPGSFEEYQQTPSLAPGSIDDSAWIDERVKNCNEKTDKQAPRVNIPFGRKERQLVKLHGPTRTELKLGEFELADREDIDKALDAAKKDIGKWRSRSIEERMSVMVKAVEEMRSNRGKLDESLMMSPGKAILEADEEVNESMDFLNLARLHMGQLKDRENLEFVPEGDGVATVICPKNFPQAIPLAHIVARLLAGYRVIVKPSGGKGEETFAATYAMVRCLWDAGVPKESLIFLPCDNENAAYLAKKSERIGYTGSTMVAKRILESNPNVDMIAETGGRNFMVVTGSCDLKATATEVLRSMCGFAGQKCSKPRTVILTKDVDVEVFKAHLVGQLKEMLEDTALTRHVDVTPLTREYGPRDPFYRHVMDCAAGEEWLDGAKPKKMGSPGIRMIKNAEGFDFTKIEEIFAPIISIAQIDGGVEEAVEIINSTKGSLTGSIFTENREEIFYALNNWKTGNLYVRRGCTAAKGHQGFGDGTGDSHLGAHGAKTGTVEWQIMNSGIRREEGKFAKYDKSKIPGCEEGIDPTGMIAVLEKMEQRGSSVPEAVIHAGWSYLYEHAKYFSQKRPAPYQTKGQYDWIESQNVGKLGLIVSEKDSPEDVICKIFAAVAAGNHLNIYVNDNVEGVMQEVKEILGASPDILFEDVQVWSNFSYIDQDLLTNFGREKSDSERISCLMYANAKNVDPRVNKIISALAAEYSVYVDRRPVTGDGLVDMVTQFRQQSYCWVYNVAGDTGYEDMIAENHPEQVPYKKNA
jgi:RHH-type proline utilization regulon transcriptional repressor/proline dehydrogenase/delta 1-pyrroline-5-carboxylate dehydrogenase